MADEPACTLAAARECSSKWTAARALTWSDLRDGQKSGSQLWRGSRGLPQTTLWVDVTPLAAYSIPYSASEAFGHSIGETGRGRKSLATHVADLMPPQLVY